MEITTEEEEAFPSIKEMYVFNSLLGENVNESSKVLYYYPPDDAVDTQLKRVGLCEATIKFSSSFNKNDSCRSLHTEKLRYVFVEPEPNYWFVLVIKVPKKVKTIDGHKYNVYIGDGINDNVFEAIITRLYERFVLLNEPLQFMLDVKGLAHMRDKLKRYLNSNIKKIDTFKCGITDLFRGTQFLPLSRAMFLTIQCFLNNLHVSFSQIYSSVLLQGDRLMWSGVDSEDIKILYDYVVSSLLSQHFLSGADQKSTYGMIFKKESHVYLKACQSCTERDKDIEEFLQNVEGNIANVALSSSIVNGLNTSSDEVDEDQELIEELADKQQKLDTELLATGLGSDENRHRFVKKFHLLIYKMEKTYVILLVDEKHPLDRELVNKLETFFSLNFSSIAKTLKQTGDSLSLANKSRSPGTYDLSPNNKFLYFNNFNLAEKITPGCKCDVSSYQLLPDLRTDLLRVHDNGEVMVKLVSDTWIVAKCSNMREYYAIFNQRGLQILEIEEEMRKLMDAHLHNIFFQD